MAERVPEAFRVTRLPDARLQLVARRSPRQTPSRGKSHPATFRESVGTKMMVGLMIAIVLATL